MRRPDRHPHDLLIGGENSTTHGNNGLQCHLGIGYRRHDLGQVRLTRYCSGSDPLGLLTGLDRLRRDILNEIDETTWPGRTRAPIPAFAELCRLIKAAAASINSYTQLPRYPILTQKSDRARH